MKTVDAHFHNWRHDDVPWLTGRIQPRIFGPCEPIRPDDPISDYRASRPETGAMRTITRLLDRLGDGSTHQAIAHEIATFDNGAQAS